MSNTVTEDLTSQVDGVTTTFTTSQTFIADSLEVHLNGNRLRAGVDFEEDPGLSSFTFIATPLTAPFATDFLAVQYEIVSVGGGGSVGVLDEGVPIGNFDSLDFKGVGVTALPDGTTACIFIPPPEFLSHWNTSDGSNGDQFVTNDITSKLVHVSTPSGGEGSPFKTNGWENTNRQGHLPQIVTIETPGDTTGFGGDSTMTVDVYEADGSTLIESFTTPAITENGTFSSGNITVTISNYGPDSSRFKAKAVVEVDIDLAFTGIGQDGGRYHIEVTHTTDSTTDGNGPFVYIQPDIFLDTNQTTPSINGTTSIAERAGFVVTKHLSGLEYYTIGSQFTVDVTDIDDFNENSHRIDESLVIDGSEYGLPSLSHSPFGVGSANFIGWSNNHDQNDVDYSKEDWTINAANFRYIGPSGNISALPRDPWANGSSSNSPNNNILVDTYGIQSTDTYEPFVDEARRELDDFSGAGSFDSVGSLLAGEAMVFNDQLISPQSSTYVRSDGPNSPNTDWSTFDPGINPNYTGLVVPVKYNRRFTQASGINIPSFTMVFSGTFVGGNALADLISNDLEILIYRIAIPSGTPGVFGPPPGNTRPLRLHEPFNFALYDDGLTIPGSGIRLGASSGNTIEATFGTGTPADTGFYMCLFINNSTIKIGSISVTLN